MEDGGDITGLIAAWRRGDKAAENALFDALYARLHGIALRCIHGQLPSPSLGATALIHEAYLRFHRSERIEVADRYHFLRLAAKVMRQILVDRARARRSEKRGGDQVRVEETEQLVRSEADAVEILAVDRALGSLKRQSPRQAQVVELRYFAGYSLEETALVLGVAERTVKRDWDAARTRLKIAIDGPDAARL
jgi:RNA polymerase sigma factor (TIGR02999 family)